MNLVSSLPQTYIPKAVPLASVTSEQPPLAHGMGEDEMNVLAERVASISQEGATLVQAMAVYDALEAVKSILGSMPDSSSQAYKTLEKKLDEMEKTIKKVSSLSTLKNKLSVVRNWIQAGYDRSVLETDPEGVQFVGEGDLTFSIKMYKDAHEQLLNSDIDIHIIEGKVHVKVEGEWRPVSDIAKTIVFDPVEKKYTGWTYTHPTGFVFSDSMDWNELLPCAQLSEESLKAVQEKATLFWTSNKEIDPGVEKKCTLQVAVTAGDRFFPNMSLFDNADSMFPRHVRIRMIDEEGHVFSFSTKMSHESSEYVLGLLRLGEDTGFSVRTADSKIVSPDYEETRKFLHSDVASIPMSTKRLAGIKDLVEKLNSKGGVRFCFTQRNCCRFSQEVLRLAGVDVDTRIDGPAFLYRILPDLDTVPYIGRAVAAVAKVVERVFCAVQQVLCAVSPKQAQHVYQWVRSFVTFIPRMLGLFVINFLFQKLGGNQSLNTHIREGSSELEENISSRRFQQLISSFTDLFKKETSTIYHSRLMCEWIQKQGSYQAFDNKASGLCVIAA